MGNEHRRTRNKDGSENFLLYAVMCAFIRRFVQRSKDKKVRKKKKWILFSSSLSRIHCHRLSPSLPHPSTPAPPSPPHRLKYPPPRQPTISSPAPSRTHSSWSSFYPESDPPRPRSHSHFALSSPHQAAPPQAPPPTQEKLQSL